MKRGFIVFCWVFIGASLVFGAWLLFDYQIYGSHSKEDARIKSMSYQIDKLVADSKPLFRRIRVYEELSAGAKERLSGLDVWMISDIIVDYCRRYEKVQLTPDIILAVWQQESNFNPAAVSDKNARGLGQLMWMTARAHLEDMGHTRPNQDILFDPVVNAEVSIREIVRLRTFYVGIGVTGWQWPISAYFWGTGNIWRILWYAHEVMVRAENYREKGVS